MKPIVKGMFARSLAGHDKGKLYVIARVEEPYVYLIDGKIRTADRPKKKKLIHVQPDYEVTEAVRDEDIRKAIKAKLKEDSINV
ncbi:MAG: KOW domain-containing RNA-binding protein [Fusicatenibacter sp.]